METKHGPLRKTKYDLSIPSSYLHESPGEGRPLLLLAHGFSDSAPSFFRRAFTTPPAGFEFLAPNGPFPLPQRVNNEWKEAYGWYFADLSKDQIYIHPSVAAGGVAELVRSLDLEQRPKVLLGFSQGGYFLPHLAHELKNVQRLVTIGAGFHPEYFRRYGLHLPVTAIHGDADEVVPLAEAREGFEGLGDSNTGGRLIVLPGMTHTIDDSGRAALKAVLSETQP
jgi:predicted esterase